VTNGKTNKSPYIKDSKIHANKTPTGKIIFLKSCFTQWKRG